MCVTYLNINKECEGLKVKNTISQSVKGQESAVLGGSMIPGIDNLICRPPVLP